MPEVQENVQEQVQDKGQVVTAKSDENNLKFNIASNPFDDTGIPAPVDPVVKPESLEQQTVEIPPVTPAATATDETVDADEFLTKETGWKSWDEAKAAKAELEQLKSKTTDKFKWEEKEDEIFNILNSKKQLDRVEKLDATKPKDAAEIIKLDLLYKNKDLTQDDVDFIFSEKYDTPEKPEQKEDQSDDDYAKSVKKWERQVEMVSKRMAIDAKLAKPELSKFKSELVLPDISRSAPEPEPPSQESLDAIKAIRENFLKAVDTDFAKFDGFTTKVKDESVEYPVTFKADDKDKAELKKLAQEMNIDEYFGKRWFDEKGNTKVQQMMSDLFLLEKTEKAFQGVANNAASERRKEIIRQNSNIKLNGVTQQTNSIKQPPELEKKQREEAAIWSA